MQTKTFSQRYFYSIFSLSGEGFVGHETDEKILVKAACGSGPAVAHSE